MTYSRGSWCVWVLLCKYIVHSHAPCVRHFFYDEQNKGIFIKLQSSSFPGPTQSSLIRNSSSATKAPGASVCMHGPGLKAAQRDTKECQIIALLNYCWLLLTATLLILLLEMKQTHTAHMHTCRRCCCFFVCYHRIFA